MTNIRYQALEKVKTNALKNGELKKEQKKISETFGQNVFNVSAMKEYLSENTFLDLLSAIKHGSKIDFKTSENVAKGMKKWAMDKGVTHFTHWFQPLTGSTAEKHDAFYKPSMNGDGQGVESLSGSELIQREPDASSFPSGGLRNTAEARGYTIWDPSSPAFVLETETGKTLYIPSVFVSWTGESLDTKTPLLKSDELLNNAATAVCRYFDSTVHHVVTTLGWEQEYFIVDESLYTARPDLVLTGRTLFGSASAKGQQLEDHYFASIPERVHAYIIDFEREALKLGIPVLTRHNEVAPGQYECAPMFEELNVSVDHNLLVMDLMERVAKRHGLRILLHEKPFAGINGSGKHNNWSMATDKGKNLLSPGSDPATNLQFLTFFINIIKAIHSYEELLRAGIATPGNDHRLGANEAPPAIISVFTGKQIEEILKKFKKSGLTKESKKAEHKMLDLNIPKIPSILVDATDRNRTSPFPFTGNKFEFRAVGSSANCAPALTILNTIVAHQLIEFKSAVDKLVSGGKKKREDAIVSVLQKYITESENIIFNGNNYSEEWEKEAKKRGLSNNKQTPEALKAFVSDKAIKLFEAHKIFSKREVHARYHILLENYIKVVEIEALMIGELSNTHIIPAGYDYVHKLGENYDNLKETGLTNHANSIKKQVDEICTRINSIKTDVEKMNVELAKAHKKHNAAETAQAIAQHVKPYFTTIRNHADDLEQMVDDHVWRLPKYRELLFVR